MAAPTASIDLYWLPLGAGGHSVRLNGKVFEVIAAALARRERRDLYHSGLEVCGPDGRYVIEQAPAWGEGSERGVVAEGAVGARAAGRFRLFRYEVRRWRDGVIPDIAEAVESPRRLSEDPERARSLLEFAPQVPTPVWGRDELRAGEMWNSNSTISWLITRCGLDVESIPLPRGGRAPGLDCRDRHRSPRSDGSSSVSVTRDAPHSGERNDVAAHHDRTRAHTATKPRRTVIRAARRRTQFGSTELALDWKTHGSPNQLRLSEARWSRADRRVCLAAPDLTSPS